MARDFAVKVDGLDDFRRDLRKVDRNLGPELRRGLNETLRPLVSDVRRALPRSTRSPHIADTVRPTSSQREARITIGTARLPYAGPLEFGGYPPGRWFVPQGRYVFPTAERHAPRIIERFEVLIDRLIIKAGF